MGDEGMDPCECIWNHELNMRRLITFLRQSQSYCTDIDCTEELQGGLQPPPESAGHSFMTMFLVMAMAVAMYMMRPRRNRMLEPMKPARGPHNDDNGAPPAPPRT